MSYPGYKEERAAAKNGVFLDPKIATRLFEELDRCWGAFDRDFKRRQRVSETIALVRQGLRSIAKADAPSWHREQFTALADHLDGRKNKGVF